MRFQQVWQSYIAGITDPSERLWIKAPLRVLARRTRAGEVVLTCPTETWANNLRARFLHTIDARLTAAGVKVNNIRVVVMDCATSERMTASVRRRLRARHA